MTKEAVHILIVEDDEAIAEGLALNLKLAGYQPVVAGNGADGLKIAIDRNPALILLDMNLPEKDGMTVLDELRSAGRNTPVIVLSARQDEYDKVGALRLGADDYITKPFALAELLARVDAVLRRASGNGSDTQERLTSCTFGDVEVDLETRQVTRAGENLKLTHLEFELLSYFVRNAGRVFSREQLLRNVWGNQSGSKRTVDNFVGQLRAKLEFDPDQPRHFITVRGSGYRFDR